MKSEEREKISEEREKISEERERGSNNQVELSLVGVFIGLLMC